MELSITQLIALVGACVTLAGAVGAIASNFSKWSVGSAEFYEKLRQNVLMLYKTELEEMKATAEQQEKNFHAMKNTMHEMKLANEALYVANNKLLKENKTLLEDNKQLNIKITVLLQDNNALAVQNQSLLQQIKHNTEV